MNVTAIFGSACVFVFASFVSASDADNMMWSFHSRNNFNNGTDENFSRFNPFGGGTWRFPNGTYQIQAPASPFPGVPGQAGSFHAESFADVTLNWDLVDWDANLDQAVGGAVRVNEIGAGTFEGYLFVYNTSEWQLGTSSIRVARIEKSRRYPLDRSDIELDPAKDYRFEFTAIGNNFTGQVFDLEDLTTALASVTATDSAYAAGQTGLKILNWSNGYNGAADATFDNFRALAVLKGDVDGDADVDFTDFSVLAGNFTGTLIPITGGKTRNDGDFDGDGDVDFGDFSVLAGNFTGTITAAASDTPPTEGDVHLEIDLANDGVMTFQPNNANVAGYSIRSPDSQLVPDADGAAAPFMFYLLNASQEVTAGSVGATTMLSEDLALDISFAGDADQAANVVFEYTRAGDVTPVDGVVHVIPEPATMILLTVGGLMVMPRRRLQIARGMRG